MTNKIQNNVENIWSANFVILTMATLCMSVSFYFLISALPIYFTEQLHISTGLTGLLLSIFTISALLIRPITGYTIDTYGRKWLYLIAFFFMAILFNFYLVAITITAIIILRLMHGLAWGITTTVGATIAVDLLPASKRGQGLGIYGLSMPIAMALGPMIGLFIVQHFSYSFLFITGFVISLLGFGLLLFIKFPKYKQPEEKAGLTFGNLIEKKSLPLSINVLFITVPYGGVISFIAIYAQKTGIGSAALFFLIFAVGIAIARLVSGKIFDKHGPHKVFLLAILLLIAAFPALALIHNMAGFLLSSLCIGTGYGAIFPLSQAMVNNMVDVSRRGAANSTLFTAFDLGIGAGMAITGIICQYISLSQTYLLFSGVCIIALLIAKFIILKHYERNKL